jgi:hypothetical protein
MEGEINPRFKRASSEKVEKPKHSKTKKTSKAKKSKKSRKLENSAGEARYDRTCKESIPKQIFCCRKIGRPIVGIYRVRTIN